LFTKERGVNRWCKAILLASLAVSWATASWADSFQALAVQRAQLYGEKVNAPAEVRDQYLSQGQEYLRHLLRTQVREWMSSTWMSVNEESMRPGVAMELNQVTDFLGLPLDGQVRVYANEDLNRYLTCGRFLPIEIELDSAYSLTSRVTLNTKLEAPFDDIMRLQVGPEMAFENGARSYLEYHLQMDSQRSDGLAFGIGFDTQSWRWRLNYEITSSLIQIQHLSLAKDF
jgi:hypothetical protein